MLTTSPVQGKLMFEVPLCLQLAFTSDKPADRSVETHNLDLAVVQSILISLRRLSQHCLCMLTIACGVFEIMCKANELQCSTLVDDVFQQPM